MIKEERQYYIVKKCDKNKRRVSLFGKEQKCVKEL
jgi:hypothetical protein